MILVTDKSVIPKTANDVKLISGGKILENDRNVAQCRAPFGDLPSNAITMHVVVQPSSAKSKPGEFYDLTVFFMVLTYRSYGLFGFISSTSIVWIILFEVCYIFSSTDRSFSIFLVTLLL